MTSSVFVVYWKPSSGLPITQGRYDALTAAVDRMRELVAGRTATGEWSLLPMPSDLGEDPRSTVLQSRAGAVESYFISGYDIL